MIIELKSYSIEIAEMLIIARCIEENPKLSGTEISRLLGIGRSNFYRKIKLLDDDRFREKLIDLGYTLSTIQITKVTAIKIK
jgi:DNA-binding MarR family transcriptional regulator